MSPTFRNYPKTPREKVNFRSAITTLRYTELSKLTNITDHNHLLAIVEYLEQSGLVYLRVPLGGAFDIRLTTKGYQSLQDKITSNVTVMIAAYEILFKLENHMRRYIESKMRKKLGTDWWEKGLSDAVRSRAGNRKTNENKSGWDVSVTNEESEYLLFEDLSKIIINNWDNVFKEDLHEQLKIILKLTELELIRHAIAHTRTLTLEGMTRLEQYSNELLRLTTD